MNESQNELLLMLKHSRVPLHLHGGIVRYIAQNIEPGSFLRAVLENDLKGACARADEDSKAALWDIVGFLYNYAPMGCWGSPDKVSRWIEQRNREDTGK